VKSVFAQTIRISGRILEADRGEPLPGATLYAPSCKTGTTTEADGTFTLLLPADSATIRVGYVGYLPQYFFVDAQHKRVFAQLLPDQALKEVVITDTRTALQKVQQTQMSLEEITTKEAKILPSLFGEVDLIRILQLKPGVQSGSEGTTGMFVRGGSADQNLFLLDEAVVYNPSHLFGFLSVFNPDAVKSVELYKGSFPAQYGGRLSSVVDVKLREGNTDTLKASGGIGLVSSRATLEGPLYGKGKSSFILSARRTYFDAFTRIYNRTQAPKNYNNPRYSPIPNYYFYDLNGRATYQLTPRDKLIVTGYAGRDVFSFQRSRFNFNFTWGNTLLSARLLHRHSARMWSESSVTVSDYRYTITNAFDKFRFQLGSGIQDVTARFQVNRHTAAGHLITAGAQVIQHRFTVGRAQGGSADRTFSFNVGQNLYAREYALYASDQFSPLPRLEVVAGVRISGLTQGPTLYNGIEPRLQSRWALSEKASIKASYNRTFQYVHLVSPSASSIPTDIWYPSGALVRPQVSDQVAAGFSQALGKKDAFFFGTEVYYKNLARQVDFKDGANLFINQKLDTTFIFGKGWAYGSEFYLEKKHGRTTGWIGYTLSWTWRQFADIDNGRAFHPRNDRRHDLTVVVSHRITNRLLVSGTFVYGSGNAVTLPVGRAFVTDVPGTTPSPPGVQVVPLYGNRNNFRMAPYHRADVSLVYLVGKKRQSDWTFSVYNLYNRLNPYFYYVDTITDKPDGSGPIKGFQARQVSLFPIIPSVAYNFKF